MRALKFRTGHVTYKPTFTHKFQLKTTWRKQQYSLLWPRDDYLNHHLQCGIKQMLIHSIIPVNNIFYATSRDIRRIILSSDETVFNLGVSFRTNAITICSPCENFNPIYVSWTFRIVLSLKLKWVKSRICYGDTFNSCVPCI